MSSASQLGIGLTMFLRDQFSGPARNIKASASELTFELKRLQEDQLRRQTTMYTGLAMAGAAVVRGMSRQIKKGAEYTYEMEFVKAVTQASTTQFEALSKVATKLAGQTMFYPQDIAEGMRFMAMAGMNATEVSNNISGAVSLAGATMSQLGGKGGAADIMTNVMKQFGIESTNTIRVADMLSYAVSRSNTNLFDLGEAIKYAGATSMDLNITLEETTAMVMALGNAGMQGSMAGVAMENAMRYISRAFSSFGSGPSQKALAEVGLTIKDVTDQKGNLLSMVEVMKKVGNAIDQNFGAGMNVEKQAILQALFGVRGKRAASLFIRNLQEFDKFAMDVSTKSAGHSGKVMEDMMSTLHGETMKMTSAFQSMWVTITKAVTPVLKPIIIAIRTIAQTLDFIAGIPFLGPLLTGGVMGFILIKTAAMAYKAVVSGLKLLHSQMIGNVFNMAAASVGSWNTMTAAAKRYAGAAAAGNMAGMVGAGMVPGLFLNKAGRIRAKSKTGPKFVSHAGAAAVAAGAGRIVGGKVITGVGSKLIGILGGPLGMALSFIIPGLITAVIGVIRGSKKATEENTGALTQTQEAMSGYSAANARLAAVEYVYNNQERIGAMRQLNIPGSQQPAMDEDYKAILRELVNKALAPSEQPLEVILNVDSTEVARAMIKGKPAPFIRQ